MKKEDINKSKLIKINGVYRCTKCESKMRYKESKIMDDTHFIHEYVCDSCDNTYFEKVEVR